MSSSLFMVKFERFSSCLCIFVCLLLLLLVSHAQSWGPLTHQSWACQLLLQSSSGTTASGGVASCYSDSAVVRKQSAKVNGALNKRTSYVLGGSSPDAVKKLSMRLHSFEFASYQYQYALALQKQQVKKHRLRGDNAERFDPIAFSLAYGNHLTQDVVGHWRTGYLTPEYDHPIEFAADTFQFFTLYKPDNFTLFPFIRFDADAIDFITRANEYFANHTSTKFEPFTRDQIQQSIASFEQMVMLETGVVVFNSLYKDQMVKFDFCQASDYTTALAHLNLSTEWAHGAAKFWLSMDKNDPNSVDNQIQQVVSQLYGKNNGTIC